MRRSNKSHKVPNVKLRPALPPTRTPRSHDPDASRDHSSDSETPPNPSIADLCPRPFKNFTICATGSVDKPTLFKMAFELGAISTSDLTDRVTHLIANAHGGAKYMCALELKTPIMAPDWITESHAIWLRGDDVDVEQSVSKYRLPIFSGVVLSLSGIEDVNRRAEIGRLVTVHQGIYLKNIERPVKVTHLLCSGDTETEKMKYAEKFNKRKEANIHLIWEEWFWDCLEFGGRFDERKYQVSRPRPERKFLQENPISPPPVQDSAPGSDRNSAIPVDNATQPKRLKHAVPAGSFSVINNLCFDGEEEEMAIINKPVHSVTLQLWESLLKPRGFQLNDGKLVRSPSKSQVTRSPPLVPMQTPTGQNVTARDGNVSEHGKEKDRDSVISSFRRARSFAPIVVKEPTVRQPFRRNATCSSVCPGEAEGSGSHDPAQAEGKATSTLFAGHTFRLLGEARCPNVRNAIENGGGIMIDDDAEEPSFIIVRLISGSKLYRDEFDDCIRTKYRTECWLEHSVFHERICGPSENVSFTPLTIVTPVPDAEKIILSLSGLDQSQLCWIRRLVRAVGITLEPTFSRRSTHLLCSSGSGTKFEKALEWRIPVVSLTWLEDIARTGAIPHVDEYLVGGSHAGTSVGGDNNFSRPQHMHPVPQRNKGKGKEKEVDFQMVDITNANDDSANQPIFIKNPALLQDTPPREWEVTALHHCDMTLESKSPPRNALFGKPRFFTHNSDPPEEAEAHVNFPSSSPPSAPPPSSSPPPAEAELPPFAPTPPILASRRMMQVTPTRQPSVSIHDVEANTRARVQAAAQPQASIPSSKSPSPMKIPPSSSFINAFDPSPPARLPDADAIAKALHESLTSLLGKRPIAEEDVEMKEVGGARKGKRVRPGGQSNMASREASRDQIVSPSRPAVCSPVTPAEVDVSLLDGLTMGAMRSTDESLRVTYEDPGQEEEKRRLLRMLGGDEPEAAGSVAAPANAGRTRRTKRAKIPGF